MRGIGEGAKISDGDMAGTTGQNRRIEGIYIWPVGQMDVTAHMKDVGDKKYSNITGNTLIGTRNKKRRIEAIMIASKDTLYMYRVQRKGEGWTGRKINGQWAGDKGVSTQIEAIEIRVVNFTYKAHVQGIGWMGSVPDGVPAGTTDLSKRMEALMIDPMGFEIEADGIATLGTFGQALQIEAIEIRLAA